MKRSKLGLLALAAAGGALAFAPSAANATSVDQALGLIAAHNGSVGTNVEYSFNDADTAALYREDGVAHTNYLQTGDVFVGSFKFSSLHQSGVNYTAGLGAGSSYDFPANEVTGIYAIQVASITQDGNDWNVQFKAVTTGPGVSYTNAGNPADTRSFTNFFQQDNGVGGTTTLDSHTMFKLYQDSNNDTGNSLDGGGFDNGAASNGNLYAAAGVDDTQDTYTVTFNQVKNPGIADATGVNLNEIAGTKFGYVNSGSTVRLSITDDGSADGGEGVGDYAIGDYYYPNDPTTGAPYQVTGSVNLKGSGSFGVLSSEDAFQFQLTVVPLPAAVWSGLALMGLLGAGMVIRRRHQAA